MMSQVVSVEDFDRLEQFTNAITTYNTLKNKADKTFNEQEAYLEACNVIGNSKQLVTDNYNGIIKKKIAEAYGIKDPLQVSQIGVYSYEEVQGQELYLITEVDLPDGRKIINANACINYTNRSTHSGCSVIYVSSDQFTVSNISLCPDWKDTNIIDSIYWICIGT